MSPVRSLGRETLAPARERTITPAAIRMQSSRAGNGDPFGIASGNVNTPARVIAWLRARSVLRNPPAQPQPLPPPALPGRISVAPSFSDEYGRVLRDSGAFGLIVMGPLLYAVRYPQPYVGQLIRDIPIAVVDDD